MSSQSQLAAKSLNKINSGSAIATDPAAAVNKPAKLPSIDLRGDKSSAASTQPSSQGESLASSLGNIMLGKVAILSALLFPGTNTKLIINEALKKIVKTEEKTTQNEKEVSKRSFQTVINSLSLANNQLSLLVLPNVAAKIAPALQERQVA